MSRKWLLLVFGMFEACGGDASSPSVSSVPAAIRIDSLSQALQPGETKRFNATVLDGHGKTISSAAVTWSSSSTDIATVDANGTVTAKGDGSATITAQAGSISVQTPVEVGFRFADITTVYSSACASTTEGKLYCWGADYYMFPPKSPPEPVYLIPTFVPTPAPIFGIRGGWYITCGLSADGIAYCTGNRGGLRWYAIGGAPRLASLTIGGGHICGLATDARAFCWGSNHFGELGANKTLLELNTSDDAVEVAGNLRFKSVDAGVVFTCARATDDKPYCWGGTDGAQFRHDPSWIKPAPAQFTMQFDKLYGGEGTLCGLTAAGQAYCWGSNSDGQLGIGSNVASTTIPQPVSTAARFTELTIGYKMICGLTQDGTAYCWGDNENGTLGDGTTTDRNVPVAVQTSIRFKKLSVNRTAGKPNICGISTLSLAYCWGENFYGQLGTGDQQPRTTPVRVRSPGT